LGSWTERLEQNLVFGLAGTMAGMALLDAGTGDGTYAIEAAARGAEVTGLDTDPGMLAAAKERARERAVQPRFVEGRIEALPFADASFDVVLAVAVLCFIADPVQAVRELARVLRPGGTLVVGDLARYSLWAIRRRVRGWLGSPTWRSAHFRSRGELRRAMAAAGLQVVAIRGGVYFPHSNCAAQVLAGFDPWLSKRNAPGAAFLAISAQKPGQPSTGPAYARSCRELTVMGGSAVKTANQDRSRRSTPPRPV
jgi:2-polyprenyl-3-methyl-5-hydroxy-6-metoxy-1,4-benzoquinol methylase